MFKELFTESEEYTLKVNTSDFGKMNKAISKLPKGVDFEEFDDKGVFFSNDKKALELIKKKLLRVNITAKITISGEV